MFESIEEIFGLIVNYAVLLCEFAGVSVLIVTLIKAFLGWIKKKDDIRLYLAQGIALALEFKLGSEVLRSVLVRSLDELIVLGAVVVLRAAITFLLHWEIKTEQKAMAVRDGGSR